MSRQSESGKTGVMLPSACLIPGLNLPLSESLIQSRSCKIACVTRGQALLFDASLSVSSIRSRCETAETSLPPTAMQGQRMQRRTKGADILGFIALLSAVLSAAYSAVNSSVLLNGYEFRDSPSSIETSSIGGGAVSPT